jgi:hypothetical protein
MSAAIACLLLWGVASLAAIGWWGYCIYRTERGDQ